MKEKFIEQFGVAVHQLNSAVIEPLNKLNVDLVQIPLHIIQPSVDLLDKIVDSDTKIIGKFVPPKDWKTCDSQFFRNLFLKYKDRIKIWDFGGEPETQPHQPGCRWFGTPEDFAHSLEVFHAVGKEVDPDNEIGSGGFLSSTFNGFFGNEDRSDRLRELFDWGILDHMDFCSLNMYCWGYGGRKNIVAGTQLVRTIIAEYGRAYMPIVTAEMGVPCEGDPRFYHIIQTERRQAISVIENTLLQWMCGIDYSIWFCFNWAGWGLMKNLQPRESYMAYQTMIKLLKETKFIGQIKALPEPERHLTDKVEWYKFEKGSRDIHIVFLTGGRQIVKSVPAGAKALNMFGERIEAGSVIMSAEPLYFICNKNQIHPGNFLRS
jgi:hypothetical protein